MYMQHLPLLERLFPDARYVHLIRDGRDAAVSFLAMPEGIMTRSGRIRATPRGFACQWRDRGDAPHARSALGSVRRAISRCATRRSSPTRRRSSAAICDFAALAYDAAMLGYAGQTSTSRAKPHQQTAQRAADASA